MMRSLRLPQTIQTLTLAFVTATCVLLFGCGGRYGGGGGGNPPGTPNGLTATAGNAVVNLSWTASSGATGYYVKRSTTTGSETQIASATATTYADTSVTNGTTYYYVVSAYNSYGQSANSNEVAAAPVAPGNPPPAPTGLAATADNSQIVLTWNASSGAAGYYVLRSTTSGAETKIATVSTTTYSDTSVTSGTIYYYVVQAYNSSGPSANSNEVSATPAAATAVAVTVDVLKNRHSISPYVYGGAFPNDTTTITNGLTVVRWGGNASSTYNWKLFTDNADNDYYFEDFAFCGLGVYPICTDSDSTQFIKDVQAAGSNPLMTMVMMNWVAQSPETPGASGNLHWTFSVSRDGPQCKTDPYNSDAGNGLMTDCKTPLTASATDINDAYFPLLDGPPQTGDPANSVYRNQWATALATAFGSTATCPIPYFPSLTSCHFYDMDNEIDIWGGTHFDIHPNPSGYDELRDVYLTEARNLKGWDPAALRLGPVSCCWWFYWNGANSNDKGAHAGIDFLPWWLNEVYWQDQIAGSRSLDIFDIHAYPDGPDTTNFTQAQKQALAASIYRDYWDPALVSPSGTINQQYTTNIQPNKTIAFRIPRMRAIVNATYPGTPLAFTEWSAEFAGASDFSTALGDADAYGVLGRERVSLATRWTAPISTNPNFQALKLYTNYDGAHHSFGTISVSDTNSGNPNLFSSYAALDSTGKTLTVVVLNKDPQNSAQVTFNLNGFSATSFVSYTLASTAPTTITASSSQSWSASQTFAPYSATLLVITGSMAYAPASDWDLNPDTIMVPAGGTVTLQPKITSGTANVTLLAPTFDSFEGAAACSGAGFALNNVPITPSTPGMITVLAPSTPGFCHFSVTGNDGTVSQTEGGWIVVGNPAASLAKSAGDNQSGTAGTVLPTNLSVTLSAGQSGGSAAGASILFTSNAGSLTNVQVGSERVFTGPKVIAVTNSSGVASVTLMLPSAAGSVTVTAEGPYSLGHPVAASFTETAN